jgi:hypothetical protein
MISKIPGGYYIKARKIQDSEIAHATPAVREIWDYILREANHTDKKYGGFAVKRGQLFRSYQDIRDALSWRVGYRTMRYSEDVTKKAMKALRRQLRITTTKALGGVLITVLNYDFYQNPKNYDGTDDGTDGGTNAAPMRHQCGTTLGNKNERMKECKKEPSTPLPPTPEKNSCPVLKIVGLYHEILPELATVQKASTELATKIKARWTADKDRQALEWWRWYFEGIRKCGFLMGRKKDWAATLHWLSGKENMEKVLSGYYLDRDHPSMSKAEEDFLNEAV